MEIIKQFDSDPEDFYSKQSELRTVKKQEKIRKLEKCELVLMTLESVKLFVVTVWFLTLYWKHLIFV